jgi:hypothetical protein
VSDACIQAFSIMQDSGFFFPIFENKPKVYIIFHQTGVQSNLKRCNISLEDGWIRSNTPWD